MTQFKFYTTIVCFALISFSGFSQTADYKKDNLILDSITKGLKTYSVRLITKDTSTYTPSGYQADLVSTFKFLKGKKIVSTNPDFTFNILIDNISLQYPSTSIEQPSSIPKAGYDQNRYKVWVNYNLSMRLQIITKYGYEHYIQLVSNENFQKHFYVTIPDPNDKTLGVTRPDVGMIIERYVQKFTINIPLFITDLNAALREYRRK